MSRYDLAAVVLAAYFAGLAILGAFTRNGRRLVYVTAVAVHRLFAPAEGEHALDQPAGVRDVLRGIVLSAAWHMPRYWTWRAKLAVLYRPPFGLRARGCVTTPLLTDSRAPAAASAPGEGTVLAAPGTVPLPPGAKLHPYRDPASTRADRFSLRPPSYYSDPAEPVGAATGDFPRLLS